MKKCVECGILKSLSEFHSHKTNGDGLRKQCKLCRKSEDKIRNAAKREYNKIVHDKYLKPNRELVAEYLLTHPCIDCGEPDIVVLDFDHVKGKKLYNIAAMCNLALKKHTLEELKNEMSKCVVRCSNCHRRKTAKDRNYWRLDFKSSR